MTSKMIQFIKSPNNYSVNIMQVKSLDPLKLY